MLKIKKFIKFSPIILALVMVVGACSPIPVTGESNTDNQGAIPEAEAPVSADEADSPADASAEAQPEAMMEDVQHNIFPLTLIPDGIVKVEIDTSVNAEKKVAVGDSLRLGNFERPFTQTEMAYHPETDLLDVVISEAADYFYFTLTLNGIDDLAGFPSAFYGVEIDSDLDGRGDFLLWVKGDGNTDWNIDGVMVLADSNDDIGGSLAVIPDSNPGNGYDQVLFSKDTLDDPDAAWKMLDAEDANVVHLAVKKDLIGSAFFLWKAWSDGGVADPAMFDYNDNFTDPQAGSPLVNNDFYPVNELDLVDSTCWIAYNFQPSGNELGGCYKRPPTPKPSTPERSPNDRPIG